MLLVIAALLLVVLVVTAIVRAVQIIPQATAAVVERLGRFKAVEEPGLVFLVPFVDKIRARIDLREQVRSFPPQPVITKDNLTVNIDTVVYYQVTNPKAAVYEIADYINGVEQTTTTTLRNVVGGLSLEETLTARDEINSQLRGELDKVTGGWGIRIARVEIKAIEPPASIQESMERQMKADREKRAMILTAEGQRESAIRSAEGNKQSQILTAEGAKQAAILNAEADRQSRILRAQGERAAQYLQAQGEAKAIEKVFAAIKSGRPTPELPGLPVPADAPADGAGRRQQGVDRAVGLRQGARGLHEDARRPGWRRRVPVRALAGGRGAHRAAGGRRRGDQGLVRHVVGSGDRPRRGGRAGAGPRRDPAVVRAQHARGARVAAAGWAALAHAGRAADRRRSGGAARRGQPPRAGAAHAG